MRTSNFEMNYIAPEQANKEVFFNENLNIIDNFLLSYVEDFTSGLASCNDKNLKYIITEGTEKNKIAFYGGVSKGWELVSPKAGMMIFVKSYKSNFYFDGINWAAAYGDAECISAVAEKATITSAAGGGAGVGAGAGGAYDIMVELPKYGQIQQVPQSFTAPAEEYRPESEYEYLYLNSNVNINLNDYNKCVIHFIIKQNYSKIFNVNFEGSIIWSHTKYEASKKKNNIDFLRLYKLPETGHFIGEVVYTDLNY